MSLTERKHAPYRADIVGSFLRPERLKNARKQYEAGSINREALTEVEDNCIRELVQKELEAGLLAVTDGEYRRSYWHLDFMWGFEGIDHVTMERGYLFQGEETRADSARVVGKIRFVDHPFLAHYRFLNGVVGERAIARQTIPAPAQFLAELVRGENEQHLNTIYPSREDLFRDLAQAYHDFILALYKEGCRNLQLDDCTWGMLCDAKYWATRTNGTASADELKKLYIRLNNAAIAELPEDLILTTHVCRGNYHSTWAASGGYAAVAEELFANENVHAYYLEFDDERSGGFEPLQYLSANKLVVLGLITTKSPKLEEKAAIIKRIREAERYVPLDRLCLSPQCGFASTEEGNKVTEEEQWAKLQLVQEIAKEIWG